MPQNGITNLDYPLGLEYLANQYQILRLMDDFFSDRSVQSSFKQQFLYKVYYYLLTQKASQRQQRRLSRVNCSLLSAFYNFVIKVYQLNLGLELMFLVLVSILLDKLDLRVLLRIELLVLYGIIHLHHVRFHCHGFRML